MKRTIAILLVFLLLGLYGCAETGVSPETLAQSPDLPPADYGTNSDMPDNMQENMSPEGFTMGNTVIGRVESIVGNEVVLELGETDDEMQFRMFEMPDGEMPGGEIPNGEMPNRQMPNGETPNGEMPARPSGDPNTRRGGGQGQDGQGQAGTPPAGMTPGEGMEGREFDGQERQGGRAPSFDFEITYTGETATYLLPVGMQIGTGDYTTVKAGMVLLLVLDDDGAITRVSILSQ